MAPSRENLIIIDIGSSNSSSLSSSSSSSASSSSSLSSRGSESKIVHNKQLPRLSMESLRRTISDMSLELITKQAIDHDRDDTHEDHEHLPEILEGAAGLEEAKCECCGMSEECTGEYVGRVRAEFGGRLVCGLCAEAVGEEMARKGTGREKALVAHVSTCSRFSRLGRTHPLLFQAEAIKEILKKTTTSVIRAKSLSPRDSNYKGNNGSTSTTSTGRRIARSSSCIPAIREELDN